MPDVPTDVRRVDIRRHSIRLPSFRQPWSRFALARLALFGLLRLNVVDWSFLASASTSTGSIPITSCSGFLKSFIMLLHLFLELPHLSAGKAAGGERGKGLFDVDGEDLEDLLHIHAVFGGEPLSVKGPLQLCSQIGYHAAVPLSFARLWRRVWRLLLRRYWSGMTGPFRDCRHRKWRE